MFTLRQLKEFDTIYFVENEGLLKTFSEINIDPSNVIFFLDKGVIKCRIPAIENDSEIIEYYYFEHIGESKWLIDIYTLKDAEFKQLYELLIDFSKKQKYGPFTFEPKFSNKSIQKKYEENKEYYNTKVLYSNARIFYGVFAHFTNLIEQEGSVIKKVKSKRTHLTSSSQEPMVETKNRNETNNKKHKVKLLNSFGTEYELEINNSVYTKLQTEKKQAYQRHIDAWTVRGHIRHYKKTGKEVLIRPYKKGHGNVTAKDYVLCEE